jgi:hypothetical protein
MRNVDSTILTKLQENEFRPFHCLQIVIDGVSYRYTDCDIPIVMPGDLLATIEDITLVVDQGSQSQALTNQSSSIVPRYEPMTMKFSAIAFSTNKIVDKMKVEMPLINNPDLLVAFVGGTPQGSRFILRGVLIDNDYSIVGNDYVQMFEGEIDDWNTDEEKLSIYAVNALTQWDKKTIRIHSSSCSWKVFKGEDKHSPCFYDGNETWCDRTYARCQALGNTGNFGGFRWLPSITDKEIWWGRTRSD